MSRKLRQPKGRRDQPMVSRALFQFLLYGNWLHARELQEQDQSSVLELFDTRNRHQQAWLAIVDAAIEEWAQAHPGTRPRSWWWWSAPELRRLSGGTYRRIEGAGRCHNSGIPYIAIDGWRDDPPYVEATPTYLDRLDLWVPGERARVPTAAFEPQRFSFNLTIQPHDIPDAQESDYERRKL